MVGVTETEPQGRTLSGLDDGELTQSAKPWPARRHERDRTRWCHLAFGATTRTLQHRHGDPRANSLACSGRTGPAKRR